MKRRRWKPLWGVLALLSLGACGGPSTPAVAEEEVSATWTSGDDEPLDGPRPAAEPAAETEAAGAAEAP